ncbi:MAG: phosphate ABC transporter substrate-binding protein PstS [Nitrososphaera sp.]|jgi:phosphate ABC transporter phosphate-binding protein
MTRKILAVTLMLTLLAPLAINANAQQTTQLNGAGSTFVFPLMDKWRVEYNKLHPDVQLNYQSIGSGAGINLAKQHTIDFAASDAPLSQSDAAALPGTLTIPESIGAVTISYNLPGVDSGLKMTGPIIADIFMGTITKWNDPAIMQLNPSVNLPDQSIVIAHRSDGSGTTYAFTDYLSKVSDNWKSKIGIGKTVPWPVGIGGNGNAGVASVVKSTKYSVGYVELAYALQNNFTYAAVQNADGTNFVMPTLETVSADASGAVSNLPKADGDWSQVSIANQPGHDSYPISTFTYIMINKDLSKVNGMTLDKAKVLVDMINWMITDGQQYSESLLYPKLPDSIKTLDQQGLAQITFNGAAVPEFGPIVEVALVIAIMSVIVLSSKSRLVLPAKN